MIKELEPKRTWLHEGYTKAWLGKLKIYRAVFCLAGTYFKRPSRRLFKRAHTAMSYGTAVALRLSRMQDNLKVAGPAPKMLSIRTLTNTIL